MVTIPLKQSHSASVALYQNDLYKQLDVAMEEIQTAEEAWRQLIVTDILEKNLEKLNKTYELVASNEELDEATRLLAIANIKSVNEDLNLDLQLDEDTMVAQEGILDAIASVFKAIFEGIRKLFEFIINLIRKFIEWIGSLFGNNSSSGSSGGNSSKAIDETIAKVKEIKELTKEDIEKIRTKLLEKYTKKSYRTIQNHSVIKFFAFGNLINMEIKEKIDVDFFKDKNTKLSNYFKTLKDTIGKESKANDQLRSFINEVFSIVEKIEKEEDIEKNTSNLYKVIFEAIKEIDLDDATGIIDKKVLNSLIPGLTEAEKRGERSKVKISLIVENTTPVIKCEVNNLLSKIEEKTTQYSNKEIKYKLPILSTESEKFENKMEDFVLDDKQITVDYESILSSDKPKDELLEKLKELKDLDGVINGELFKNLNNLGNEFSSLEKKLNKISKEFDSSSTKIINKFVKDTKGTFSKVKKIIVKDYSRSLSEIVRYSLVGNLFLVNNIKNCLAIIQGYLIVWNFKVNAELEFIKFVIDTNKQDWVLRLSLVLN